MVKRNINTWDLYLTVYNKLISKQYGGFLIISSGSYYLQMYVIPDEEKKDTGTKCIHIEAVSHYYLPEKKDFSEQFNSLGFEIDFYSGNYSMESSIDLLSDDQLVILTKEVFAIYGKEILPYELEWNFHSESSYADTLLPIQQFEDTIPGIEIKHRIVYQRVLKMDDGGFIVKINDKCGCLDKDYNPTLPCIYDNISLFSNSRALVERDSKYGYLDESLQEVIPCIYEYATEFVEGKAWVVKGDKWGLIDLNGVQVMPFIYDNVGPFSRGIAWVKNNIINAVVNQKGEIIKDCDYEGVTVFRLGHAIVRGSDNKRGIIDESYEVVVPLKYDSIDLVPDGYIYELRNGAEVIEKKYVSYDGSTNIPASQYYHEVSEEERLEQYRIEGERINSLKGQYDSICHFCEGLSKVRKDGKYGFIDADGNVVIPLKYSVAKNYSEGLAVVKENDKYGFINP